MLTEQGPVGPSQAASLTLKPQPMPKRLRGVSAWKAFVLTYQLQNIFCQVLVLELCLHKVYCKLYIVGSAEVEPRSVRVCQPPCDV